MCLAVRVARLSAAFEGNPAIGGDDAEVRHRTQSAARPHRGGHRRRRPLVGGENDAHSDLDDDRGSAAAVALDAHSGADLEQAKADGYVIITPMIPNMGYHFLNPKVQGFDVTKPPILVYVREGDAWQLVAIEWVFPKKPATAPLQGARYGSFGAACHYVDGSFGIGSSEARCSKGKEKT